MLCRPFNRVQHLLIGIHGVLRRSGALDGGIGATLFHSAYIVYKRFEDHLEPLLRRYPELLAGGNALDVGANVGYTASVLARRIDPARKVYAFEPEPRNFRMLQNVAASPKSGGRIEPFQLAVGEKEGVVQLWLNDRHHADHRVITAHFRSSRGTMPHIAVPVTSIDRFLADRPGPVSLVKIDVQGFEPQVCRGMSATLEGNPDMSIVLEYAPGAMRELGFNPADVLEILRGRGLACYALERGGRLSPAAPEAVSDDGYTDFVFTRRRLSS